MNPALSLLLGTAAVAVLMILLIVGDQGPGSQSASTEPLVMFCAAGVRPPVEEVAREYEAAYGIQIQLNYGGSQTLLSGLKVSKQGDLYLPGDETYIHAAQAGNLARESIPLSAMEAVLCVKKGNPKGITSLAGLLRDNITLAQASPDAAAIGKLTRQILTESGHWEALKEGTEVFKGTVNEVVNDVKLGAVDAAIAWDAVVSQQPGLEFVRLPELAAVRANISIAVLTSSTQPAAALRFARYLAARDKGLLHFVKHGYAPGDGDPWEESPVLNLYSGAMLRPAIEQTIKEFELREGVKVSSQYNGCGILVAAMRTGERPDAYFSCETSFMNQVQDLFLTPDDISMNRLVILVAKGNPHGIRSLQDLGRENLSLGLAHEKQSALGSLTRTALLKTGSYEQVRKNLSVESPTGDFLVNQILTGSLDAVVVYLSNANAARDKLEIVPIETEGAVAIQPVAVGRESEHKQLASRLIEAIKTAESKERFLSMGFNWQWQRPAEPPLPPSPTQP